MARIEIEPGHRALIVGTSGSGKSVLVKHILVPRFAIRPVVYDPKEKWSPPDESWIVTGEFDPELPKQIIRLGDYDERDGPSLWDEQTAKVLEDGNHTLIIDELALVTGPSFLPKSLRRAVVSGRDYKRGSVGVWMVMQRCAQIPLSCYSESRHLFAFQLTREDDRERWGRETNRNVELIMDGKHPDIGPLANYDYVYYNVARKQITVVRQMVDDDYR